MEIDLKKFLSARLNNGLDYRCSPGSCPDLCGDCGCVKGNFRLALGFERLGSGDLFGVSSKVFTILNIGEYLTYMGHGQKGKLFVYNQLVKLIENGESIEGGYRTKPTMYKIVRKPFSSGFMAPIVDKVKTRIKETTNVCSS